MRRSNTDLLIVVGLALLAALVSAAFSGASNLVTAVLAVPFVLFLPGYALSAVLLPDGRAGLAERIAIALGLSIAVTALSGLLLNFSPWGLTAVSWRILLFGVTLIAAACALWRREKGRIPGPGPLLTRLALRDAALLGAAALLIGLALGLGALGRSPTADTTQSGAAFTQLWAVPQDEAGARVVQLGLHNLENVGLTYRVTLEVYGDVFAEWPRVTLKRGETWEAQATIPAEFTGEEVTANAYLPGSSTPYRRVRLAAVLGGGG